MGRNNVECKFLTVKRLSIQSSDETRHVSIVTPSTLSSGNYKITLPNVLPTQRQALTLTSSGVLGYSNLDVTTNSNVTESPSTLLRATKITADNEASLLVSGAFPMLNTTRQVMIEAVGGGGAGGSTHIYVDYHGGYPVDGTYIVSGNAGGGALTRATTTRSDLHSEAKLTFSIGAGGVPLSTAPPSTGSFDSAPSGDSTTCTLTGNDGVTVLASLVASGGNGGLDEHRFPSTDEILMPGSKGGHTGSYTGTIMHGVVFAGTSGRHVIMNPLQGTSNDKDYIEYHKGHGGHPAHYGLQLDSSMNGVDEVINITSATPQTLGSNLMPAVGSGCGGGGAYILKFDNTTYQNDMTQNPVYGSKQGTHGGSGFIIVKEYS